MRPITADATLTSASPLGIPQSVYTTFTIQSLGALGLGVGGTHARLSRTMSRAGVSEGLWGQEPRTSQDGVPRAGAAGVTLRSNQRGVMNGRWEGAPRYLTAAIGLCGSACNRHIMKANGFLRPD